MHLKIIFVPFFVVLMLVYIIGFIQPDILALQTKRVEIQTKMAQVDTIETILENIATLNLSLDSQKENEAFVKKYVPNSMDQGNVIDALNFSASNSGVIVENMEVIQAPDQTSLEMTNLQGQEINGSGVNPDGSPLYTEPLAKTFTTEVTVRGNYENIKDFISKVTHMDRFYSLKNFTVGFDEKALENASPDIDSGLQASFLAAFDYIKVQKKYSALSGGIFTNTEVDLSSLQPTLSWVTNHVPVLEKPSTGKVNPFSN